MNIHKDYANKEKFLTYYEGANSVTEILRRMGKTTTGSSFEIIKKYCLLHGLEVPVSSPEDQTKNAIAKTQILLSDVLVANRKYNSSTLKKRLVKDGLLKDECSICQITEWNNNPITLHLDHINGDHLDNRLENLRILCPNCHSQTNTWGNKKR